MKRLKRSARWLAPLVGSAVLAGCTPFGGKPTDPRVEPRAGSLTPAPAAEALTLPFDAAPSPDGETIYYTALGSDGELHALWRVPADGSTAAVELATGFSAPLSITVSADGDTIYVADAGHDTADPSAEDDDGNDIGALFRVPAEGGEKTEVAGTYGLRVRGVESTGDALLLTGTDPADGQRGVFLLDDSGVLSALAKGQPFVDPSGIAATLDGDTVYVIDTSAGADEAGVVIRVQDGTATRLSASLAVGYPAGCALSLDESTLFVSGVQDGPEEKEAAVHAVNVDSGAHATVSQGLEGNDEAGGLHRARDVETFAWSGSSTVYRITFE